MARGLERTELAQMSFCRNTSQKCQESDFNYCRIVMAELNWQAYSEKTLSNRNLQYLPRITPQLSQVVAPPYMDMWSPSKVNMLLLSLLFIYFNLNSSLSIPNVIETLTYNLSKLSN